MMVIVSADSEWETGNEMVCVGADGRGSTVLQHDLVVPEGFTREPPLFVHS